MKIARISVFRVMLPLKEGSYKWSGGKGVTEYDSTVIRVDTDAGVTGWGECVPLGPVYLPSYAPGVRTGLRELGPALIGLSPLRLPQLNRAMDAALKGHNYVKSAVDIACWDILGKVTGQPVCTLLGGRYGDSFPVYRAVSLGTPDAMVARAAEYRAQGLAHFQLKVGSSVDEDIARIGAVSEAAAPGDVVVADANTGWLRHEAMRVVHAVSHLDNVYIEQPCLSYDECLSIRRHCPLPFVLDECIDSIDALIRAHADHALDAVNIKVSRVGGLTRAREFRDLCGHLGIPMTVEDTAGSSIAMAAVAHLAHSTPPELLFSCAAHNERVTLVTAEGAPRMTDGRMSASTAPGLGVEPIMDALGAPLFEIA